MNLKLEKLKKSIHEKDNYPEILSDTKNLILIVPSYGNKNLLEVCGIELIDILLKSNFKILLRPHFRIFDDSPELMNSIKENFGSNPDFILETGIIPSKSFFNSLCMISDWSGISLEYVFTFEHQVIFIDVPKKNLNSNVNDISLEPIEIQIRDKIGKIVSPNNLEEIPTFLKNLQKNDHNVKEQIRSIRSKTVYNIGNSATVGAKYIQEIIESNFSEK